MPTTAHVRAAQARSPVFVARFSDGQRVRMTVWQPSPGALDLARGIRVARAAYEQRTHRVEESSGARCERRVDAAAGHRGDGVPGGPVAGHHRKLWRVRAERGVQVSGRHPPRR